LAIFLGGLLLGDNHHWFAIGILKGFGKYVANILNILLVINKTTHSTVAVMRNRAWQSEAGYEPTDRDRSDYHRQRLVLVDLDVYHREMLGAIIIAMPGTHREVTQRR
jgi:hypothetical protein